MDWDVLDFVAFIALLGGVGVTYTLAARSSGNSAYRFAVGIALAAAFLLVWVNAGVGIIGNEQLDANMMYFGVLAIGLIGAAIARFRSYGMARALFATAFAQALVGTVALVGRFGSTEPSWPWDVLALTGFFATLWLLSAWLFRKASQQPA